MNEKEIFLSLCPDPTPAPSCVSSNNCNVLERRMNSVFSKYSRGGLWWSGLQKKSENSPEKHLHRATPSFSTGWSHLCGSIKQCFLQRIRRPGSSFVSWCKSVAAETEGFPTVSKFAWGYWITRLNGSLAQGSYHIKATGFKGRSNG